MAGRTLAMLLVVYGVSHMDRQLLALFIEPIRLELDFSDAAAGLLYGFTFAAFYSVLGIPIAWLADRTNRVGIIIGSLVMFSAMTAACAWAGAYWHLLLARIGVGIGEAGTSPASHSIIADLYPLERRSFAMAIFVLGPHAGIAMGFLAGGFLGQVGGWRAPFLIAGIAGLAVAAFCACTLKEPQRLSAGSDPSSPAGLHDAIRAVWQRTSLRHLFIGATVLNIAGSALFAWLPAFLMRTHGLKLGATGALLALVLGVLGGCGTLLGGWLSDRLGARVAAWRLQATAIVQVLIAPLWASVFTARAGVVTIAALMLAGAFIAFHMGPTFAMVQSLTQPRIRALTAALLLFAANFFGFGVGPYVVGVLSDAWVADYGPHSLRLALMIVPLLLLWGAAHYAVAARALAADLRGATVADVPTGGPHGDPADNVSAHFR